jgi:histidyl-tRNA synthetase
LEIFKCETLKSFENVSGISDDPIKNLFKMCEYYGISEWIKFDPTIVRGLSYYTGIIFECFAKNSALKRALMGGGRYDKLLETFGYKKNIPAVGYGLGDVTLLELLGEKKLIPEKKNTFDYYILPYNSELYGVACDIANKLRNKGKKIILYTKTNNEDKFFKKGFHLAGNSGADFIIIIAPDEWKEKKVRVKNLKSVKKENEKGDLVDIEKLLQ